MTESMSVLSGTTLWMTIAAFMVFLMQAGFLLIEAGAVRSKNSTNVAQKNVATRSSALD